MGPMVGLLDIFGMEAFKVNGFEQLLINYANEKLQALFVAEAVEKVKAEFIAEGISLDRIEAPDNRPVVELLEGRVAKRGQVAIPRTTFST